MADDTTPEVEVQTEPSDFAQHMRNSAEAVAKQWGSLIPGEFWDYGREARKEFLLGMRAAVDSAIDRLERRQTEAPQGSTRGPSKVQVEVD
ncbi:MAG: hypothetical protein GYB64_13460 [Chloroflexi bacterium]|nr:hypothetical protein [Chloroflexota bacterium]